MSDSGSPAPKVLVLHGYVAYCTCVLVIIGVDVILTRYGQSAHIFSKRVGFSPVHAANSFTLIRTCQLAALKKSFGKDLEFGEMHPRMITRLPPPHHWPYLEYNTVFINAPHVLEPVDLTGHGMTLDTLGASEASAASEDPALKPRAWYKSDPTRTRTDGLEESLAFLRDTVKTQCFEVRHQMLQRLLMIPRGGR